MNRAPLPVQLFARSACGRTATGSQRMQHRQTDNKNHTPPLDELRSSRTNPNAPLELQVLPRGVLADSQHHGHCVHSERVHDSTTGRAVRTAAESGQEQQSRAAVLTHFNTTELCTLLFLYYRSEVELN